MDGESIKKVHAYKLMTQMDAMISDYSSIVFDYMLLDRPIAWALEDVEHYKIDFLMDNPLDFMPGEKIYNLSDLFAFLEHVSNGEDLFQAERNIVSDKYNAPRQGRGCENIVRILGL
jgi:CDP-glycerol glycerophosphotransferase (TagB/SpsB family)